MTTQNLAAIQANSADYQVASNNSTELGVVDANDNVLNTQLTEAGAVTENANNDQLAAVENTNAAGVQATQIQANYATSVAGDQTQIATATLADQTAAVEQSQNDQYNTTSQALSLVSSGQLNKGGEGGALQAGVVAAALGASPASANQVAAVSSEGSTSVIDTITNAGATLLKGLFA